MERSFSGGRMKCQAFGSKLSATLDGANENASLSFLFAPTESSRP